MFASKNQWESTCFHLHKNRQLKVVYDFELRPRRNMNNTQFHVAGNQPLHSLDNRCISKIFFFHTTLDLAVTHQYLHAFTNSGHFLNLF